MSTGGPKFQQEKGQILVLIVLIFGGLLGLSALVIDGGMIFSDRRYAQNVADSSSMAGAGTAAHYLENHHVTYDNFSCSNSAVIAALQEAGSEAVSRAASNNFTISIQSDEAALEANQHGVYVSCFSESSQRERYIDVKVKVTSTSSTAFIHLFFPTAVKNTVESLTRIYPRTSPALNYAIASLSDQCGTNTGGVDLEGTNTINVIGGGVFSNSCMTISGTSLVVNIGAAGIKLVDSSVTLNGSPTINPAPTGGQPPLLIKEFDMPTCGSSTSQDIQVNGSDHVTIDPGNYSKIKMTGGTLKMNPGLYCLTGDIEISGGMLDAQDITLYSKSGLIKISATSQINMTASAVPTNGSIPGMLILMDKNNHGDISLLGNGSSVFRGTVYGLNANIDVGGNNNVQAFDCQLIGQYVKVHGTAMININFSTADPFQMPTSLSLMK
jgi:hypothetical protein